ncbi:uncharacterized protein LOC126845777 isoform X4 [Adelges cooleyi]|uniref:uncharacterized protein LOC126845777 isoform X4 n=1 Tax=Adelges cooleyi TaxID=133065 RepID=UPI0021803614|nr:uncharacterized protein LOC126845777 isoform X4 [Adelges cooleyi]
MAFSKTINFSITIAAIFFVSFTIVDGGDPKEQVPSSSDQLLGTQVIHHYIDKNGEKLPSSKVDTTGYKIVVQEDALFKEEKFNNYYGKSGLYPPPSFKPAAQSSKLEMTGHKIVVQEDGTGDSEEFVVV